MFDWKEELFHPFESPYAYMFRAGCIGIPIEEIAELCKERMIPLRDKDVRSWKDGHWLWQIKNQKSILNPKLKEPTNMTSVMNKRLSEFPTWPEGWTGTDQRWYPCSKENVPLQEWGYMTAKKPDLIPTLYTRETAIALSSTGWVGQNLYAQPFIVIDIDGRGHGCDDLQVIKFGNQFRTVTEVWEDPFKPGSFHLYFNTHHQIPIAHFTFAKLDLMGNQKNAAVYTKNKVSNGNDRAVLTEDIWESLKEYVTMRKEQRDMAKRKEAV